MPFDAKDLIEEVVQQGDRVEGLLARAAALRLRRRAHGADRVAHSMQASVVFQQSANNAGPLVFTVPKGDQCFEALRLTLLPELRLISVQASDGTSEVQYRPTLWACQWLLAGSAAFQMPWPAMADNAAGVGDRLLEAQVELDILDSRGQPRPLQNAPFPIAQAFSGAVEGDFGTSETLVSRRTSALEFDIPLLIAPGAAFQARITPVFSGVRDPTQYPNPDTRLNEYRIIGVLEGFKRVSK